jgi:glycosyltransferase involved in cell wall biosynthesis
MSSPDRIDTEATSTHRGPRRGTAPTVSVVIASNRDKTLLHACIGSLLGQCQRLNAELLVARAGTTGDVAALAKSYPSVRFIAAPADAPIPQLRAIGMSQASGDVVALTEDHCIADDKWVESLTNSVNADADVVGGGMDNAKRTRSIDWAAYFAEYGFFSSDRPESANGAPLLTGANIAYKRHVIADVVGWAQQGEWENVAHTRLVARGSMLRFARTTAMYQNQSYSLAAFCTDRYTHGRDYARKRLAEEPGARRWLMFAASPLLPALLTWRVARASARNRVGTFLRALPATMVFLTAWSVGEAVGYLKGPAESSPPANRSSDD